ncbi:PREDICTED: phosphatidylinositol N-acetylglucosaminyltransferase subunit P [Nicrophorus vespilloides]|uniref:Phosphatidylinositol N-acetylglucosaminyltransferase subunit P n=1 Tax=Nicrophorus vespilloides TaxID=110193 RepID=A0ABM1MQM7_NICVS|nr:PREDICTED: phosphatidylinositol N-acetylglucosaminyltransferase subunit P [Nicrophorus vespilloides]
MPEHTPAPTQSRAVYGFALHLILRALFFLYTLWAMIPDEYFISIGITYLPNRYWAVTIPIFLLSGLATFAFIVYPSFGLYITPNLNDERTIMDSASITKKSKRNAHPEQGQFKCICKNPCKCEKKIFDQIEENDFIENAIPTVQDINMLEVSEHLYL